MRRTRAPLVSLAWLAASLAAGPALAEPLPVLAYVTCQNGDALSILDLASGTERARIAVPGKPAGVAAAPDGSVYTVSPEDRTVRRLDPDTGALTARVLLDGGPMGIALDPTHRRAFVSDWYNARIWVLDLATLAVTGTLTTGAAPAGLAVADGRLASADRDADQVSLYDLESLALLSRIAVGSRPYGLGFAPDGRLFVGNVGSNDVSVIDPGSGSVTATLAVGERPYGVAFARGRAFVSNQYADSVSVIDLASLAPVATIDVGEYPEGIDTTPDGATIAVTNWFENTVTLIDAEKLAVTGQIATADGPRAFGRFIAPAAGSKESRP